MAREFDPACSVLVEPVEGTTARASVQVMVRDGDRGRLVRFGAPLGDPGRAGAEVSRALGEWAGRGPFSPRPENGPAREAEIGVY